MPETREPYVYKIDGQSRIVSLSSNWLSFARENQAGESLHPDRVLGRSIWEFISGTETQHLYELVFQKVRTMSKLVAIKFRCDAPDLLRFCNLAIVPHGDGSLELYSQVVRTQARASVRLLDPSQPRSAELIRICSVCKRVVLPDDRWVEIEVAISALKLFEAPELPQITHVACPDCLGTAMAALEKLPGQGS
jgi:hypothetical protein